MPSLEPAHEVRASEVGEDKALAQPLRSVREHRHLGLLPADGVPLIPEAWQVLDLLLRHEDEESHEGCLTLEDRLGRRAAVVLLPLLDE